MAVHRVWRGGSDTLLAGLGRRVTSLFGFGEAEPAQAREIICLRETPNGVCVLTRTALEVWSIATVGGGGGGAAALDATALTLEHDLQLIDATDGAPTDAGLLDAQGRPGQRCFLLDLALKSDMTAEFGLSETDGYGSAVLLVAVVPRDGAPMNFVCGCLLWGPDGVRANWLPTGLAPKQSAASRDLLLGARLALPPLGPAVLLSFPTSGDVYVARASASDAVSQVPGYKATISSDEEAFLTCPRGVGSTALFLSARHGGCVIQMSFNAEAGAEAARAAAAAAAVAASATIDGVAAADAPATTAERLDRLNDAFERFQAGDPLPVLDMDTGYFSEAVAALSRRLVDAAPGHDPRWAEEPGSISDTAGAATSLIIATQLERKRALHALLLDFLRSTRVDGRTLWQHLGSLASTSIRQVVLDDGARLAAAVSL
eukprot:UC1_evm1s184